MRRPPPKHRLPLLLTCLLPCLGACSGVRTDATPGANLAAATTYAWMIPPPAGAAVRRVADDLLRHRLEAAVEGRLAARGMRKVARDSADVLVHAGLSVTAKV